ncbi:MAG: hypothetical protein LBQ02_00860 [Candidatus Nomurabacteria bacterium]|jgi:hypothetical protein|nr:hypothetical protein [Candidatus Nomurabacteria bacterium]
MTRIKKVAFFGAIVALFSLAGGLFLDKPASAGTYNAAYSTCFENSEMIQQWGLGWPIGTRVFDTNGNGHIDGSFTSYGTEAYWVRDALRERLKDMIREYVAKEFGVSSSMVDIAGYGEVSASQLSGLKNSHLILGDTSTYSDCSNLLSPNGTGLVEGTNMDFGSAFTDNAAKILIVRTVDGTTIRQETGYAFKEGCLNLAHYDRKNNAWELKTGSWSQVTTGANPNDGNWKPITALGSNTHLFFTHSAGVQKKDEATELTKTESALTNASFTVAAEDLTTGLALSAYTYFPDFYNRCTGYSGNGWNWFGSGSWELAPVNGVSSKITSFSTSSPNIIHNHLTPTGGQSNYTCSFELKRSTLPESIRDHEFKFTSTITLYPKERIDFTNVNQPVTSSAVITSESVNPWKVSVMSYAKVNVTSGDHDITGCANNTYCAGKVGVGSPNLFGGGAISNQDGPPIIVSSTEESGCLTRDEGGNAIVDSGKCPHMTVNFQHKVKVEGSNTGEVGKKQLWFYAIENVFSGEAGSTGTCGGQPTGTRIPLQWQTVVLTAGSELDINSIGGVYAGGDGLCSGLTNDPNSSSNGTWRSRLYLCFAEDTGYLYGYDDNVWSAKVTEAKDTCAKAMSGNLAGNEEWNITKGGRNEVVAMSHAVVGYKPTPGPIEGKPGEVEIKTSKTQTCAVNESIPANKCDPVDGEQQPTTELDDDKYSWKATDINAKKKELTQLARPSDSILFTHNYLKLAQKLDKDTTWVSLKFHPTRCYSAEGFNTTAGMEPDDKDCVLDGSAPNPRLPMETKVTHAHTKADAEKGDEPADQPSGGQDKTYTVSDDCFVTGRGSLFGPATIGTNVNDPASDSLISYTSVSGKTPYSTTLSQLKNVTSCKGWLPDTGLRETESFRATVNNTDVGTKELYQRVTLYDRVAKKLQNLKSGEGGVAYKTNSGGDATSDPENLHTFYVKWKDHHYGSCSASGGEGCGYTCTGSWDFHGSQTTTGCCSCGGSKPAVIGDYDAWGSYVDWEHTWVEMVDHGPVSSNAQFSVPYNYEIAPQIDTVYFPDSRMVLGGSDLDYSTWFNVNEICNVEFDCEGGAFATLTRPTTQWKVTEFYIEEDVQSDPNVFSDTITTDSTVVAKKNNTGDTCNGSVYAYNSGIQNVIYPCRVVEDNGTGNSLNSTNSQAGHTGIQNCTSRSECGYAKHTAHIADAPTGTKFCVGLSIKDWWSGANDDTYGDPTKGWWLHLDPECVSISKIPTMQVWGGGLYVDGLTSGYLEAVTGRYAEKLNASSSFYSSWTSDPSTFSNDSDGWRAFGSWSEYDAIGSKRNNGNATLWLYGSAAAFGRGLEIAQPLDGGVSSTDGCDFSKLSIRNNPDDCHSPSNKNMGNSYAFRGLADRIKLRYTNRVQGDEWVTGPTAKVDTITEEGYTAKGNWTGGAIGHRDGEVTYYHYGGSANISETLNIGRVYNPETGGYENQGKTIIVEVNGKATITGNITYNSSELSSIYEIPQVIIFADDIDIAPSVTQIDAWLMVGLKGGSGTINTCANGIAEGTLIASNGGDVFTSQDNLKGDPSTPSSANGNQSEQCRNRLKINGPVQAKKLKLLRTWGAGMGLDCNYDYKDGIGYANSNQAEWPNGGRTGNCVNFGSTGTGSFPYDSATPAEVFNLRADAYLWSYRQVENYSQAFVTYSREVAPRY